MRRALAGVTALAMIVAACGGTPATSGPIASRPPGIAVDCGDVPEPRCTEAAAANSRYANLVVVGIALRCLTTPCTDAAGTAKVGILTDDDMRTTSTHSWGSPPIGVDPPAAAGVPPTCQGVPLRWCLEMRGAGDLPPGAPPADRILVACTTTCTDIVGDGETRVHFEDGTQMRFSWAYDGRP